ncbi:MAG TPA: MaoC family dehydratase N-terminal domain-containing protein [Dehalococcoidia bacterium]|nr:MaoC family dehydratase N-terminal domain-containing protein [Dehalococcoidia bacterium]
MHRAVDANQADIAEGLGDVGRMGTERMAGEQARDTLAKDEAAQYLNVPGPTSYSRAEVNAPMVWNYCEAVEDANPVYWDEEFAVRSRFGRLIAPPQMIMTASSGHWWAPEYIREAERKAAEARGESPSARVHAIVRKHGYTVATNVTREDEFVEPYGPGDGRLKQTAHVTEVTEEKQTRVGKGVFITTVTEYYAEKDDRLVVRSTNVLLMYNSSEPRDE